MFSNSIYLMNTTQIKCILLCTIGRKRIKNIFEFDQKIKMQQNN